MNKYIGNIELSEIKDKIEKAQNIVLTAHINPDGDALGSLLAFLLILDEYNKKYIDKLYELKTIRIVLDDELPKYMSKFEENILVEKYSHFNMKDIDLLICLDSANIDRIGNVSNLFQYAKETINIDHHISNTQYAMYNYIEDSSSTSEIIYKFIDLLNIDINTKIAEYIYLGLINDTGNFRHNNVTPKVFEIASKLIKSGVDNNKIINILFSMNMKEVNLYADVYANKKYDEEYKFAYYYLPYNKMQLLDITKDETSGISERLLMIEDVDITLFVREEEDGRNKGSFRCKDRYDVNAIASHFGGGGHVKAAGFLVNKSFDEIIQETKIMLKTIDNK